MTRKKKAPVVPQALDVPRLTLNAIAEATGATRASLEKYRMGRVPMPEPIRLRLAAFLEGHARRLLELAEALRTEPTDR